MAELDTPRAYKNGDALLESDLDAIREGIEDFFNVIRLNDDNFQINSITASSKFVAASVTTNVIGDGQVTAGKIAVSGITTAKIADDNIITDSIADSAVTSAKLADDDILATKFADDAILPSKRAALDQQVTSEIDESTTSTSEVDVPGATVTITTTGKKVLIYLQKTTSGTGMGLKTASNPTISTFATFLLYRDSTVIGRYRMQVRAVQASTVNIFRHPASGITQIDDPAAGEYTYKLAFIHPSSSPSEATAVEDCNLVAYELV